MCGVLFVCNVNGDLYKIQHLPDNTDGEGSYAHQKIEAAKAIGQEFENIVRFPRNIGCTGIAITKKEI